MIFFKRGIIVIVAICFCMSIYFNVSFYKYSYVNANICDSNNISIQYFWNVQKYPYLSNKVKKFVNAEVIFKSSGTNMIGPLFEWTSGYNLGDDEGGFLDSLRLTKDLYKRFGYLFFADVFVVNSQDASLVNKTIRIYYGAYGCPRSIYQEIQLNTKYYITLYSDNGIEISDRNKPIKNRAIWKVYGYSLSDS